MINDVSTGETVSTESSLKKLTQSPGTVNKEALREIVRATKATKRKQPESFEENVEDSEAAEKEREAEEAPRKRQRQRHRLQGAEIVIDSDGNVVVDSKQLEVAQAQAAAALEELTAAEAHKAETLEQQITKDVLEDQEQEQEQEQQQDEQQQDAVGELLVADELAQLVAARSAAKNAQEAQQEVNAAALEEPITRKPRRTRMDFAVPVEKTRKDEAAHSDEEVAAFVADDEGNEGYVYPTDKAGLHMEKLAAMTEDKRMEKLHKKILQGVEEHKAERVRVSALPKEWRRLVISDEQHALNMLQHLGKQFFNLRPGQEWVGLPEQIEQYYSWLDRTGQKPAGWTEPAKKKKLTRSKRDKFTRTKIAARAPATPAQRATYKKKAKKANKSSKRHQPIFFKE
jgi:hypothetical protein